MNESKSKLIIVILTILIVLAVIIGTILYIFTDMLKSNEFLFQKYMAQNLQNIVDVIEVSKEEENIDLLRKKDFTETTEGTLKYLEKENDEEEIYDIKENGINKAVENQSYRNITAKYGENVIASIDLLSRNNMYGFRLANLVQQFVSVKNETVSYLVSSVGFDGSIFSEKMKAVDVSGTLDFTDEEIEELGKKYLSLVTSDLDKKHYTSKGSAMITLSNKESVTTRAYTLTLTQNELDKIYKKVLNQAIQDKTILAKLENIDSKIKEAGFNEKEGKSLKELYVNKIQSITDQLEYQGEDNRKIVITVYQKNGETLRTSIKTENNEYLLDVDTSNGKELTLKTTEVLGEESKSKIYSIGKMQDEQNRNRTISYSDDIQNLKITVDKVQTDDEINIDTNVNYNNSNIKNIDFTSTTNIKMSADETLPVTFDDKNNLILNDYEGDKIISIFTNLKNRSIASIENTQSIVNTKLLNNIILKIDEKEQQKKKEEQDNLELQKEKFNNKFILYEGEELEQEYIQKLLKTVGENMTDYQVISGTQIRVFIKEGVKNEEKANEILTAIQESKEKFNIKLNYGQDGYVESVDIIVSGKK